MIIPKPSQISDKNHRGTLYIKKNFPEFYEWLVKTYPGDLKTTARLYLWERGMDSAPTCPICGKPSPFLDYTRGFQRHCSLKCSNNSIEVKARKVNTSIRKWGTISPSKSDQIKQKIINTTIARHGGMGNASSSTKQKQQSTMKDRYGSEHALCNDEIKSKMKSTMHEKRRYKKMLPNLK